MHFPVMLNAHHEECRESNMDNITLYIYIYLSDLKKKKRGAIIWSQTK